MTSISFGRYTPYNTVSHRLDPRGKLLISILFIITIFFQFKMPSTTIVLTVVYLVILLIIMLLSKVSFKELFLSLKGMWFFILFLLVVYIFIPTGQGTKIAFTIGSFNVYWQSFFQAGYIILRLVMMLGMMMVLTSTTKPMDLTYAFEWYMSPLKCIHFPVSEIAMTLSIALRFIPTLLDESERIMKAQASRGVDFNRGSIVKRFKAIISLIIPLFVSVIDRSEELANAMEVRGYDPKAKRTRYRKLAFAASDIVFISISLLIFAGIVTLLCFDKNQSIDLFKVLFGVEGFTL